MAAGKAIAAIFELLEMILLHLDMRDLLTRAQLVNKLFADTIRKSTMLQRKLYLLEQPKPTPDGTKCVLIQNPLLAERFPVWFGESPSKVLTGSDFDNLPLASDRSFFNVNASWRRMLISQPPCKKIARWRYHTYFRGSTFTVDVEQKEHGLTMGEVYDEAVQWTEKDARSPTIWWTKASLTELKSYTKARSEQERELCLEQQKLLWNCDLVIGRRTHKSCKRKYRCEESSFAFLEKFQFGRGTSEATNT